VSALRTQSPEIPNCSGVLQVGPWVFLLGVDEIREFDGVTNEEDRSVVSGHVPVALLSVKLNGKT